MTIRNIYNSSIFFWLILYAEANSKFARSILNRLTATFRIDDYFMMDNFYVRNFPYRHEIHFDFTVHDFDESRKFIFRKYPKLECHVFETMWEICVVFEKLLPVKETISVYVGCQRIDNRGWTVNANCSVLIFDSCMKSLCSPLLLPTTEMACGQQMSKHFDEVIPHENYILLYDRKLKVKLNFQVGSCHLLGNNCDKGLNQII